MLALIATRRFMNGVALAAMLAAAAGCSGNVSGRAGLVPVTGNVTIDGEPLTMGMISFITEDGKEAFTSQIDSLGNYKLLATASDPGALPGQYTVIVIAEEPAKMGEKGGFTPGKKLVPDKYAKKETSGLTGTVEQGPNTIDFDLKSS